MKIDILETVKEVLPFHNISFLVRLIVKDQILNYLIDLIKINAICEKKIENEHLSDKYFCRKRELLSLYDTICEYYIEKYNIKPKSVKTEIIWD